MLDFAREHVAATTPPRTPPGGGGAAARAKSKAELQRQHEEELTKARIAYAKERADLELRNKQRRGSGTMAGGGPVGHDAPPPQDALPLQKQVSAGAVTGGSRPGSRPSSQQTAAKHARNPSAGGMPRSGSRSPSPAHGGGAGSGRSSPAPVGGMTEAERAKEVHTAARPAFRALTAHALTCTPVLPPCACVQLDLQAYKRSHNQSLGPAHSQHPSKSPRRTPPTLAPVVASASGVTALSLNSGASLPGSPATGVSPNATGASALYNNTGSSTGSATPSSPLPAAAAAASPVPAAGPAVGASAGDSSAVLEDKDEASDLVGLCNSLRNIQSRPENSVDDDTFGDADPATATAAAGSAAGAAARPPSASGRSDGGLAAASASGAGGGAEFVAPRSAAEVESMRSALSAKLGDTLLLQLYQALDTGSTDDAVKPLLPAGQHARWAANHHLIDGEKRFFH